MGIPTNPSFDLAQLGHVEVLTNKFDESLDFFTRVYGLKLSAIGHFGKIRGIISIVAYRDITKELWLFVS